jgi:hypothetical protein
MNKLKYFRQGQEISIEELNRIVDNVNDFISLYNELVNFKSEIENAEVSHNTLINNFISAYYNVIQETPNVLEILNAYNNVQQPTQVIQENVSNITIFEGTWHINGVSTGVGATGGDGDIGEEGPPGQDGKRGFTIVPTITNQVLNWQVYDGNVIATNHGLTLPSSVSLGGPQGLKGDDGLTTTIRFYFAPSSDPLQSQIIQATENTPVPNNYNWFKIETELEGESNAVSSGWIRYRQPVYVPSIDVNGNLTWTLSGESVLPNTITGINIKGEDGKSVNIKASFDDHEDLPISGALENDAYLINGYLFIYVGGDNVGTDPTEVGFRFRGFENVGLIQGPQGEQGPFFEFQKTESHIQKKLNSENVWTNFIALSELTGPQGTQGFNIQLRIEDDFIQWKISDESVTTWNNLVALENIKGDLLLLRQNGFLLEYRYDVNDEWEELFDLEPLIEISIEATSPVQRVINESIATISLADAYGDTKNPYGIKTNKSFLASPNNVDGVPSFRALVASDIASGTISTDRLPTNAVNQTGVVTAPTISNANKVWKTDASGVPGWRNDEDTLYDLSPFAPKDSPTFTGTVSGITSGMVGLGNVANESKATMFASPTFTGTVSGITATMVGLGNVDNTSDANKPVSTGQQTALNLKANLESPALTGTPTATTPVDNSNTNRIATTGYINNLGLENPEWFFVSESTGSSSLLYITVNTSDGVTFDWANYDYKFVYHGATNAEDLSKSNIQLNDNTLSLYSNMYEVSYQSSEGVVTTDKFAASRRTNILTGLGIDGSTSRTGDVTEIQLEFILSRSRIFVNALNLPRYTWLLRGEGHAHYWPAQIIAPSDYGNGMAFSKFTGIFYDGQVTVTSLTLNHGLTAGSEDFNKIRVYKRKKI